MKSRGEVSVKRRCAGSGGVLCLIVFGLSACGQEKQREDRPKAPPTQLAQAARSNSPTPARNLKSLDRVSLHGKPKSLPAGALTHDWTSFLGPTHNSISTETKLLKKWPEGGPTLVWEMEKGTSYSSPAIAGEYLVFPHRIDGDVIVECLHPETGGSHWQFRIPTEYRDRYGYNNGTRSSPVIDGDRVYVYTAASKLFCLQLANGQVLWQRDVQQDYKVPQDFFGTAATPLLSGRNLIINVGAPNGPCVAAFDKLTGKTAWTANANGWGPSYSSAVPATIHGKQRVFVLAGGDSDPPTGGLISLDPADGKVDFTFPFRSESYESVNASCPVVVGNQVFISASYEQGSALLTIGPDMRHRPAWTTKEVGLHWNTAVHKDGHFYAFDGRNEPDASLVCVELKTGKVVWREVPEWQEAVDYQGQSLKLDVSTYRGSLLRVDDRFLCLGELGHLMWLDLSPQGYKLIQRDWLFFSKETWALPVLSRGLLYVTQNKRDLVSRKAPRLLCYDLRGEAE